MSGSLKVLRKIQEYPYMIESLGRVEAPLGVPAILGRTIAMSTLQWPGATVAPAARGGSGKGEGYGDEEDEDEDDADDWYYMAFVRDFPETSYVCVENIGVLVPYPAMGMFCDVWDPAMDMFDLCESRWREVALSVLDRGRVDDQDAAFHQHDLDSGLLTAALMNDPTACKDMMQLGADCSAFGCAAVKAAFLHRNEHIVRIFWDDKGGINNDFDRILHGGREVIIIADDDSDDACSRC